VRITGTVAATGVSGSIDIAITDRPGSLAISRATKIMPSADNTYYTQNITVLVTDSQGNPSPNKEVYLKLWPTKYALGVWAKDIITGECGTIYTKWPDVTCSQPAWSINEDLNNNLALDAGEDIGPMGVADGFLTPPNAAAGSVPTSKTSDASGLASFQITYLKQYAKWIEVHLEASTAVQMDQNLTSMDWVLEVTEADTQNCQEVFNSPFGQTACGLITGP